MKRTIAMLMVLLLVMASFACTAKPAETTATAATASETAAPAVEPAVEPVKEETVPAAEPAAEPVELIVFAAASMTETMTKIKGMYEAEHQNVTIIYNFDSSGTLKTQITEGAPCDIFISAGQKQVNQIDKSSSADVNPDGLDYVLEGSRINLLENKVVLCVPEGSDKGITSFDALRDHLVAGDILFCMGNSDVPVGQYTQQILAYYNLDEAALASAGTITYGTNVKEVTTQVKEGSVDAGVVYCTDAFSAGLTPVDVATSDMCKRIIYPACVINTTAQADAAAEFLAYLQGDAAMEVFESVGFASVK